MKKFIRGFFLFIICVSSAAGYAQTISDCLGAINLCEASYFEEQAPLNTGDFGEFTGTCNQFVEWNSVWYTFTVQSDGNLSFTLTPNDLNDDYDWGLFDITNGGCDGITLQDGSSPEVSCNSWGTLTPPNGPTGISTAQGGIANSAGPGDQFGPPFNSDLPVLSGHTFALVVMNWTGSANGYEIDFSESTAALFDAIPPAMTNVEVDCSNQSLLVTFSEDVVITTAQNLDFIITGPDAVTIATAQGVNPDALNNQLNVVLTDAMTTPGIYQLVITDASGLIEDPCGNTAPDTIDFEVLVPIAFEYAVAPACNGINGSFILTTVTNASSDFQATIDGQDIDLLEEVVLNQGNYNFLLSDASGCGITQVISIPNEVLEFSIVDADTLTCLEPVGRFTTLTVSTSTQVGYLWSTEDGSLSAYNEMGPDILSPGIYSCVATTVPNGCSVSDSYQVLSSDVYTIDENQIVFPNVVSPNKDNRNDYWAPRLRDNPEYDMTALFDIYELHIYDRWGTEVFNGDHSRAWYPDATQTGVYFYTLIYRVDCGNGQESKREGTIQIVE